MSQGGLYNEGAGASPASTLAERGAVAGGETWVDLRQLTPEQREAFHTGTLVSSTPIMGGAVRAGATWVLLRLGILARAAYTVPMTTQQAAAVLKSPPAGYRTMDAFGKALGWGRGKTALKDALARTQSITLGEAQGLGISSEQAFLMRDAYRAVLNSSKGIRNGVTINEAALGREVLLHRVGQMLAGAGL